MVRVTEDHDWLLEEQNSLAWRDNNQTYCATPKFKSQRLEKGGRQQKFRLESYISAAGRCIEDCPGPCQCYIARKSPLLPFKVWSYDQVRRSTCSLDVCELYCQKSDEYSRGHSVLCLQSRYQPEQGQVFMQQLTYIMCKVF